MKQSNVDKVKGMKCALQDLLFTFKCNGYEPYDEDFYLDDVLSTCEFHIKGLKGWLFGLWIRIDEKDKVYKYDFFTQYEKQIDKFKPTASHLVKEDIWYEEADFDWEVKQILEFVKKHPFKAYYADVTFCTDLWSPQPKSYILFKWKDDIRCKLDEYFANRLAKQYRKFLTEVADLTLEDYRIREDVRGFPRFDLIAKNFQLEKVDKKGCYGLEEDLTPELEKKFQKLQKKQGWLHNKRWMWQNPVDFQLNVFITLKGQND